MNGDEGKDPMDQIHRILAMVQDGSLSPAEADKLIDALQAPISPPAETPSGLAQPTDPWSDRPRSGQPSEQETEDVPTASAELRRLSREARRMAHEARRAARRDLRDAMREAKQEIERAMRLSMAESSRAVREVEAELRGIFADGGSRSHRPHARWLSRLAGLDMTRDQVKITSSVQLEQDLLAGSRVTVRNGSGDVLIRGWDQMRLEVRGDRTAWGIDREMAEDRAQSLPVEISRRNGEVLVDARPPVPAGIGVLNMQRMRTDLVVMVPADCELSVSTKSGDVTVLGHAGPLSVDTTRGDVSLTDPQGRIKVETVSGDIQIGPGPVPELELVSVSGDVSADLAPVAGGQYRLRSASGDVTVRVSAVQDLRYEAETVSGELQVQLGGRLLTRERGRVVGEVREVSGDVGDDVPATAVASLRCATISGDILVS